MKTTQITLVLLFSLAAAAQQIPSTAWNRAIGEPFTGAWKGRQVIDDGYWQGAPIGGLGAGAIGRTYRGDFARWHLDVGSHHYQSNPVDQFSVRVESKAGVVSRVLSVYRPEDKTLSWWNWDTTVRPENRYSALFPKSWYQYKDLPVELTQLQFSPFIPHNYKESSYPVGIYRWQAVNRGSETIKVTLMFTWENKLGWWRNSAPPPENPEDDGAPYKATWGESQGNFNAYREEKAGGGTMKGIVQSRGTGDAIEKWDGQFVMAAMESPGLKVTHHTRFDPLGDGGAVWTPFSIRAELTNQNDASPAAAKERVASALAVTFTLGPGETREIPFVLAWDLPVMEFGKGAKWYKRYAKFFGRSGRNGWAIAREALTKQADWERQIDDWMRPILADTRTPAWYKTAVFNELYGLLDLGTAWEDGRPGQARGTDYPPLGRFGYLECYDYRFYSTLDVGAYGSFAALQLFPELEKQEAKLFADFVDREDLTEHTVGWTKQKRPRKIRGTTPMDLGVPMESPWVRSNFYTWQDANTLKDESPNLALKVWRDFVWTGKSDIAFLRRVWPAVRQTMAYAERFDPDRDGLPDSEAVPDQTYDSWIMTGPSAYIGGLWIASLDASAAIADTVGDRAAAKAYRASSAKARASYEAKLWNGAYYDFDAGSKDRKAVMADQLFGQFYAQMTGLPDVVSRERRDAVLRLVYKLNVMSYEGGQKGAVNGIFADGKVVRVDERSNAQEVWTGVTYSLAAFMLQSGMTAEAWKTAEGVYRTSWENAGMWFRTPEGWTDQHGSWEYRASMYMRPMAVWAIQTALSQMENKR